MPDIRTLTPILQERAIVELNEDPRKITEHLDTLKLWLEQQPHLRARTSDQFLITFLRGCKYDMAKAKEKLENFYKLREKTPEFLKPPNLDNPKLRELIKCGVLLYLPKPLAEDGPRVALVRNGAYSTEKFSFADISQLRQMLQVITMLEDDNAVISGIIFIMDFSNVTASHFFQASPGNMRKVSQFSELALPLRIKASHFIDTPTGFEPVFNLLKPLMSQKMQSRMFVHGSKRDELYKMIPKSILPLEYGGENGSIPELIDYWERKIYSYRDYFELDSLYGYDEALRAMMEESSYKNENVDAAGMMGTYRALGFD